jgi:radical SAM protein with 4Fe4S-binding SPASM domain
LATISSKKGDYFKAALRLFYNGLKFRYLRLRGAPLKPAAISLAVTGRCNSHCIMCHIWKRARELPDTESLEMPGEEVIDLLSRPLFSELVELDLTGGEPHLRDDLADIVIGAGGLVKRFLPRLRSVIVASNGLLPRRIISNYQEILEGLKDTKIDVVSVSSLDGIGQTHDRIRGTKGAFELATRTINGLLELRKEYPRFFIGLKTTILPYNVNELRAILDFALERNMFHVISSAYFTEARFRNIDKEKELALSPREHEEVLRFYRLDELKTSYFYQTARDLLVTGERRWLCTALHNYMFIDYDGRVYPCEIISTPIGDVKKQALEDIWHSPLAHYWRRKIGELPCCRACHEPGAVRYSACDGGFSYLRFLMKSGRHGFGGSFYQEGFAKYFGR